MLALAELLGMALWFSASSVSREISAEWLLSPTRAAWLTMAVQIGFVIGTMVGGLTNLPDRVNARHLFALCAFLGAACNAAFALLADDVILGIPLRIMTGVFMAGVYPVGMKLAATWTRRYRGFAIGLLVGALTIGSASPHLARSLGGLQWSHVIMASSFLAVLGGLLMLTVFRQGPYLAGMARFDPKFAIRVVRDRSLRLVNFGYLGHMWELYAMWTWVPVFLLEFFESKALATTTASIAAFVVIAVGGLSSVAAGLMADRLGRTAVAVGAMCLSAGAAISVAGAILWGAPLGVVLLLLILWGLTVIPDSAQFSAAVSELSPPEYVGTALVLQTSVGFLLTLLTIQLVPLIVNKADWPVAFLLLAVGPLLGVLAMVRLRALPEAARMAGGRR